MFSLSCKDQLFSALPFAEIKFIEIEKYKEKLVKG
jgi:hypothetical protein